MRAVPKIPSSRPAREANLVPRDGTSVAVAPTPSPVLEAICDVLGKGKARGSAVPVRKTFGAPSLRFTCAAYVT